MSQWSQLSPFTYSPCPSTEFAFISPAPDLLPFQYPTTLDKSLPVLYFYTCHLKKVQSSLFKHIFWMSFQLKSIMIISVCFYSFLEFSPTGTLLRLFGLFRPNYFLKYLAVPGPSLWHIAFFKLWHVGSSSLIRDRTWAPCTGSLTHSITREVPRLHFKLGAVLCHMQSSGPKIRDLNVIHTIMLYCVIPTTS